MRTKEFTYQKEDGNQDYSLHVLTEDENYIKGISLFDIPEDEKKSFQNLQEEYEGEMKKYMKYFKQFKKSKILKEQE